MTACGDCRFCYMYGFTYHCRASKVTYPKTPEFDPVRGVYGPDHTTYFLQCDQVNVGQESCEKFKPHPTCKDDGWKEVLRFWGAGGPIEGGARIYAEGDRDE